MVALSDQDLMLRVAANDNGAVEALAQRYRPMILRQANAAHLDPDDFSQAVLLKLWRGAHTYDASKANLTTWVGRVIHNEAATILRLRTCGKRDMRRTFQLDDRDIKAPDEQDAPTPVFRALTAAVTPRGREAVRIHYGYGVPLKRLAASVGKAEGTVKSELAQGLKSLRWLFGR